VENWLRPFQNKGSLKIAAVLRHHAGVIALGDEQQINVVL